MTTNPLRGFALGAALVLASAPFAQAAKLSIGLSTWVGYGPLYIAQDKGFFKEEGLDVDLVKMEDVKTRMPALMAGRLDLAVTTIDTVLNFYSPDHPLDYVFALDDSKGGDGIVAKDTITSVADLKGKTVAYAEGSVSQFFLSVLLKNVGLKLSDVKTQNMTAGDAGAAFVAGRVDAAVTWEPWLTRGKMAPHSKLLIDSSTTPGLITDVLVASDATVKANPDELKALYRAWVKAVDWQKANEAEADAIMAKGVGGWLDDPAVFKDTRSGIVFYDDAMNKAFIGTAAAPGGITTTIGNALELGKEGGLFNLDLKPADMIAFGIVQ
ncbi:MAG: aliphatic sulfonate ABC transporter substrate-binding protein [Rhodobacteraceae bacterium]|nr:aliphatic sulfonate ABC transporter substrate-binding protein [Paracoccaceae bacterium]